MNHETDTHTQEGTAESPFVRDLARGALHAIERAESAAYCHSPLFDHGSSWNDSPIGAALITAETALRAIFGDADDGGLVHADEVRSMIDAQRDYESRIINGATRRTVGDMTRAEHAAIARRAFSSPIN